MLMHVLDEVRKVPSRQLAEKLVRPLGNLSIAEDGDSTRRVPELPHREAENVSVERVIGGIRQLGGEARFAEAAHQPLHVVQPGRRDGGLGRGRHHERRRPRMAQQDVMGRNGALPDRAAPVARFRQLDLRQDGVRHGIDERALVRHVVVERHRLHAELPGQLPHGQRLDPALVGEPDRGFEDSLAAEGYALHET